ncbi:hypothetical protein RhiirB3_530594 [Rhizophagus irregularis]|nr:hypothetical protein RhiirB3_530594 [Rhizophagus irregularis]
MVSNGLLFTFLENKETQRFIAPALKLPGRHAISNRIFSKSAKNLTQSIVKQAKADVIGVTAAFDGWTNVKREHLFGVVFITSSGKTKTLVINSLKLMIRQLRIEYPSKVFLPCMVHQMNLVVGGIFKESLQYKQISKNAVPQHSIKTLITKCLPECIGTPSTSRTGISRQHYKTNTNNENKCLPSDIIEIINDPRFWTRLFELQNLLLPLPICGALNKLQSDVSCLYEITHCFGWIINMFSSHKDEKFGNCMIGRLESRWAQWEQPLLLLSVVLIKFQNSIPLLKRFLIHILVLRWLVYYYQALFNEMTTRILRDYLSYQREFFLFNPETYNQFEENIIDF